VRDQKLLLDMVGMVVEVVDSIVIPQIEIIEAQTVLGVRVDVGGLGFDVEKAADALAASQQVPGVGG